MFNTPHSIVHQRKALTAIVEGPSCLSSTLAGGSAGSRDILDSRPGICKPRSLMPILCRHFFNVERPRGEPTVSVFPPGRVFEVEATGRTSDCDIACGWPSGGASSSRRSEEGAGDSDCGDVNMEARENNVTVTNLVTNLVIVELTSGRARPHVGLRHGENSLRGENKQTDTSSRSSPSSSCSLDGPDFASSSCRTYTVTKSARVFQ